MANMCETNLTIMGENNITEEKFDAILEDLREINYGDFGDKPQAEYCDDSFFEVYVGTRWNVPTEKLQEIAEKHGVQIRAVGKEDGCAFVQVVCIDSDGTVKQDEAIGYTF